ncbi:MAG: hypothetical protein AAGJ31_12770 [Verrucomicrobiota bacterium]
MARTLRDIVNRLPRFLVAVNVSGITGHADEWEDLSAHSRLMDAIHRCSEFHRLVKSQLGVRSTSIELDSQIEPCILIVDRIEDRTVVWIQDGQLHCTDDALDDMRESPLGTEPIATSEAPPENLQRTSASATEAAKINDSLESRSKQIAETESA